MTGIVEQERVPNNNSILNEFAVTFKKQYNTRYIHRIRVSDNFVIA